MNSGSGRPSLLVRDGRLRGFWRILLFGALFLPLTWLLGWVVPMPGGLAGQLAWQGAIMLTAAVAAGAALLRWVDQRAVASLGFGLGAGAVRQVLAGLAIGTLAMVTVLGVGLVLGGYRLAAADGSMAGYLGTLLAGAAVLALPAAAEEALFRGYPFQALVESVGPVAGTVVFSAAFAAAHVANPEMRLLAVVNIFLAGVMLCMAYLRTGSLWFVSGVHLGWNWTVALPLDLPVSGLRAFDAPLYDTVASGPEWLTGGAFGPEGGALGTLGFVVAAGLVWWWTRRESAARIRTT